MPSTSELSFTYAGETIGGSSARDITDFYFNSENPDEAVLEFEFCTRDHATAAAFATELTTLRNAFRTPRGNLVVTGAGSTLRSLSHSTNTGFDCVPEIIKDGDIGDTGRSRTFRVRFTFGLPADLYSTSFRRPGSVNVEYTSSRQRIVTITGSYTANSTDGTTGAIAQYRAQIDTYAAAALNTFATAALFEKIAEPQVEFNDTNKVCYFATVYKEILVNQSIDTLDNTNIVDPVLTISLNRISPGDSPSVGSSGDANQAGAAQNSAGGGSTQSGPPITPGSSPTGAGSTGTAIERPKEIIVTYACNVNYEAVSSISSLYTSTIRPYLINRAKAQAGGGTVVLIDERRAPTFTDFTIAVELRFIVYGSSKVFEQRIECKVSTNDGKVLKPVHKPDPFSYYEYPGPAVKLMTISEKRKELTDNSNPIVLAQALKGHTDPPDSSTWVRISREPGSAILKQGLDGAQDVTYAEIELTTVWQFRNRVAPSVANAGGVTGAALTG